MVVVTAGTALRWVHLGTPSLWWDEVVDIAMAQAGGVRDVLRVVREGVPAGSANAGAMPLDYLLLHGWTTVVPQPRPESIEIYFRFPAFVWSVAALATMAVFARRHLGREVGLVATLLLALSIPHVLYAAEVRWYSLLVLVTIVHLWAFARLLDASDDARRWLVWTICAAAAVLTAVLSIVPLAAELLVLVAVVKGPRAILVRLIASAGFLAMLVAWLAAPSLGVSYGRPEAARPGLMDTTALVMRFLAWDRPALLAAFVVGLPVAWRDRRSDDGATFALVAAVALGFLAIPIVTLLATLKTYYVHPRHVIFLLPGFVLMAAVGIVGACRRIVPRRWVLAAAVAAVLATQAGDVVHFLASPDDFFARIKILRDVRGAVVALRSEAGRPWLLLAERESVSNATVAAYLRWYGLEQQVVFRGTRDTPEALRLLADPTVPMERLATSPLATIPVGLTPELRALLRIVPDTSVPTTLAGGTLMLWAPPPVPPADVAEQLFEGATLFRRAPGGVR